MAIGFLSPVPAITGLNLIKSQSFSAVSSVDVTSCFSSTYTNYKVLFYTSTTTPTANRNILFQLLSGTTPATTSYYGSAVGINTSGSSSNYAENNGSSLVVGVVWDTQPDMNGSEITIFKPFTSLRTNLTSNFFGVSGGSYFALSGGGLHSATSSYDGFRLSVSGTNFGGVVKVYGIQD